jgi:hypothetical protein
VRWLLDYRSSGNDPSRSVPDRLRGAACDRDTNRRHHAAHNNGADATSTRPYPAERFEERTWAVESAHGLSYLLAQQLVAAGENVIDVPPVRASRVRVLGSGKSQKNDPNDARSVAIAA